jgi:predicted kinase
MSKLIVLQGPPCSGKSTWAKEYVKNNKDTVIVSRDSFRLQFCGNDPTRMFVGMDNTKEELITSLENTAIESALRTGYSVIVDATNLNPKTINRMYKLADSAGLAKSDIEFKEFYIPFREAVERDRLRKISTGQYVGKHVLQSFYERYYSEKYQEELAKTVRPFRHFQQPDLPGAIICDLDGTLAWMQGRSPYDGTKVDKDEIDPQLRDLLILLRHMGFTLLFVSGREGTDECRTKTQKWLESHFDNHDFKLFMRKEKDYRSDEIIKKEIYDTHIKNKYYIATVFDDRNKVVDMWRKEGLLCCQVAEGDF